MCFRTVFFKKFRQGKILPGNVGFARIKMRANGKYLVEIENDGLHYNVAFLK